MTTEEPEADLDSHRANGRITRPFQVSHRSVLQIAVPMTFAYISVPMVGLVDTYVIGQLGQAALIGGITVGAVVLDIVLTGFNFLRAGTTGLTAQALGAEDQKEQQAVLIRALLLSLLIGIVVILIRHPFTDLGIWLMNVDGPVGVATEIYLLARIWATPFLLANFALIGWLIGLGRTGAVLAFTALYAGLNIVFSIWFVLGLDWGVAGVAWASVLAEVIAAALMGLYTIRILSGWVRPSRARVFDRQGFRKLIALNRDIMIRSSSLLFAFAFFTRQGAQYGEVILAANAILMHFFLVGGYFLDGLATAVEQLVGRAVGARFRPAFEKAVSLSLLWGGVIAVCFSALYFLAGQILIDAMTTASDVRAAAGQYLIWAALTPIVGVLAFQMDGVYIGATWSRDMRNMMLISLVLYLIAWAVLTPFFGNSGLWMALLVFLGARGFSLHMRMRGRLDATFGI